MALHEMGGEASRLLRERQSIGFCVSSVQTDYYQITRYELYGKRQLNVCGSLVVLS